MNIDELRKEIDIIDEEILELIGRRYELVKKVGEIKKSSSASVFVPEREQAVIERLSSKTKLPKTAISSIFREIMSGARLIESPITITYLKDEPLSVIAAYSKFGNCIKTLELNSIDEICAELEKNINSYAVIPEKTDVQSKLKIITKIHLDQPSQTEFVVLSR